MAGENSDILKERFIDNLFDHKDIIYNYAYSLTKNAEDAKDLVQEASFRAYRSFGRLEKRESFKSWMLTIVRHTFINEYRKRVKEPKMVAYDEVEQYVPSAEASGNGEAGFNERLEQIIDDLPEDARSVIHLFYAQKMSYKEIAEILDIPVGTVMSRLYKARQLLKKKITRLIPEGFTHGMPRKN